MNNAIKLPSGEVNIFCMSGYITGKFGIWCRKKNCDSCIREIYYRIDSPIYFEPCIRVLLGIEMILAEEELYE